MPPFDRPPAPLALSRPGVRAVPLNGGLWRVTRHDGMVLGYLEQLDAEAGSEARPRFRSKRMVAREQRFTVLGDYWTADDAVASFPLD